MHGRTICWGLLNEKILLVNWTASEMRIYEDLQGSKFLFSYKKITSFTFSLFLLHPWKKLTLDPTEHSYSSEEVFRCSNLALALTAFGNWVLQLQLPCCTYWLVLAHCPALVRFYTSFQITDPERKSWTIVSHPISWNSR